nr:hypothetical protein [Cronobacter dublinensis]
DEKTVIANLVAAPGAAGGSMAAGNSTGIGSGANAARVENNYLSGKEPEEFAKKLAACGDDGSCRANVMKEMAETSNKNIGGFSDCLKSGDKACINDKLSGIKKATGYDALTAQIGSDAANTYKEGLGVETFKNAIDCIGMGWEACSNKKGWKLIESGLGVLIIAKGQTIGGKLAEIVAGSKGTTSAAWGVPGSVSDKFPSGWGSSTANIKGVGFRWQDPNNKGNGVRIDQGNPNISQPTQQVDHVIVRFNGKVIGRDGKPIQGSIADNAEKAHIPLSEYMTWKNWNSPN